jgi:hypothetical protein
MATTDNPLGHAEHLWNEHFGVDYRGQSISTLAAWLAQS